MSVSPRQKCLHLLALGVLGLLTCPGLIVAQRDSATKTSSTPQLGELTVDRIYGQPSLNGHLTRGIAWSPDNKQLSYLEIKGFGKDARTELWVMDTTSGERSLLVSADKLLSVMPAAPDKQSQATGAGRRPPSQYLWAPGGDALLFESANSLAWFDLKSQIGRVLVAGREELSDVKISPDGKLVSFVRGHDLWVVPISGGTERAITTGGTEKLHKGELDWVYPEELEIFSAYWWAPDSSAIAYLEMDESMVSQFPLLNFESYTGEAELQRYPVAGGTNPTVRVLVAPVGGGNIRAMDIGGETDIYVPRVNWLPDSRHLAIQRLNREQNVLDLLLAETATGKSLPLLSEKDPYWVNVSDDLYFLKDGQRFLWSSERTGYRHLFLYDLSGKQLTQLTQGEWEVNHLDAVDGAKGLVYFTAAGKSPLERQLYRVSLDGTGFTRITKEDGTHGVRFSPNATLYTDTFSNTTAPPRQDLYSADGSKIASINENKVDALAQLHLTPVEFLTVKTHDGVALNGFLIKPPNFDAGKRYPVIIYTYGGPHAQVVENTWGGATYLWHQMMAQKGYIIFALDNRGSSGRGHPFETPIRLHLGAQELSDQRDGVAWLQSQPYVDPKRIGIWGWSYGGHMTLHAMFEAPDLFKAGFAGGPVTDWHFYDSIYTERYMGLPQKQEENYRDSSPVKYASKLQGKLLIAHGTGDDNVHYSNTLSLIDDLIQAGKYVEVIAVPGRGHGASDAAARRVIWNRVTQFFLDNL